MKSTKNNLIKAMRIADEILEYANSEKEVFMNGKIIDLNSTIFNSEDYPFNKSFDELQYELYDTYKEAGEDFINMYIDYVKNVINPIYIKCRENEIKKIYFARLTILKSKENSLNINEYCIKKITDKRVYYYEELDSDTTDEDVKIVDKNKFGNYEVELKNNPVATTWFFEGETKISEDELMVTKNNKEIAIEGLEKAIKDELDRMLNKLGSYKLVERTFIKIK